MKRAFFLFSLLLLLSGCYTTRNQRWLEKYRTYEGYELRYNEWNARWNLPAVLYRCGGDWYLAGVRREYRDDLSRRKKVFAIEADFHERHWFNPVGSTSPQMQVCYHRITPALAARLLSPGHQGIRPEELSRDLRRAGGDWCRQLPPGAQAVSAKELSRGLKTLPVKHIEKVISNTAPWYNYPAVAVSFVVEDVPLTIFWSSVRVGLSPIYVPLGYMIIK